MSDGQSAVSEDGKYVVLFSQGVALKIHATSEGVFVRNPTEGANNGPLESITGIGSALLEQSGSIVSVGSMNARTILGALNMPVNTFGPLSAASQLFAPDFTNLTTQYSSLTKFGQSVDNVDWTGGFPTMPDGTFFYVINESAATGFGVNLVDQSLGGSVSTPYPYCYAGFHGGFWGISLGSVPRIFGVVPSTVSGSASMGSRVTSVANGATTMVYQQPSVAGSGGVSCLTYADITVYDASMHVVAFWGNARYGWDHTHTQRIGTVTTATTGVPAVSDTYVPGSVTLTNDYSGGSLYRFLVTNNTGATVTVLTNNWRTSIAPF